MTMARPPVGAAVIGRVPDGLTGLRRRAEIVALFHERADPRLLRPAPPASRPASKDPSRPLTRFRSGASCLSRAIRPVQEKPRKTAHASPASVPGKDRIRRWEFSLCVPPPFPLHSTGISGKLLPDIGERIAMRSSTL